MTHENGEYSGVKREYNWDNIPPSLAVIETINEAEATTPSPSSTTFDPPLGGQLDTDALDSLLKSDSSLMVTFQHRGYHVHIGDETVRIDSMDIDR